MWKTLTNSRNTQRKAAGLEKECRKSCLEERDEDKKLVRSQDIHETKADADEID